MAKDYAALTLRLDADLRKFEKNMAAMRATADRRLTEVERRTARSQVALARTMGQAGNGMVAALRTSLAGLAPTLAAAFSAAQVIKYADSYTALQNRLRATGLEGEALKRVEDALYEAAGRNGVAVAATAELYQRAAMARENLGASEEQLLAIVSGTTAALRLQGTSAGQASGALLQLGQLLGGNVVQAQEYNSLIDGLPTVLEAVAKGSDRWGGSVNKLTQDVKAGKVTVQEWAAAMLKGFEDIEARAANSALTVGGALQNLNDQLGRYVGQADSGLSATQRMAQGINALADNLDRILPVALTLATLIGGRYAVGMAAAGVQTGIATVNSLRYQAALIGLQARQTGATTAQIAFNAALSANPIGLVITLVASLAAGIYLLNKRFSEGEQVSRKLDAQSRRTSEAFAEYEDAARKAAEATGEAKKKADELAASKRALYVIELQQAQALAETTAQMARQRAEMAALAAQEATNRRPKTEAEAIGQLAFAGGAEGEAARAKAQAEQARRDAAKAQADLVALEARIRSGFATPTPAALPTGDGSGSGRGGSRGNAAQLARARAELDLEREIVRARATGDEAAVRAAEERQELAQLVRQYEAAGVEDARGAALEHLGWLNEAKAAVEAREAAERQVDDILAGRERQLEREAEYAERATDQARDRLAYETQLARLSGDEGAIRDAERRLYIEERMLEILRLRLAMTEDEARAMAGAEWVEMDRTEAGREMAQGVVDLLRSDNIWEEAGRRFKDAAWDGIENLLSELFANMGGGKGGGGFWGTIGSIFPSLIPGLAGGGAIRGPGTGKSDSIPIMASNGEFIVNAAAAKAFRPFLEAMNRGKLPRFAMGGLVPTNETGPEAATTAAGPLLPRHAA